MKNNSEAPLDDERLSNDPEESLRLENEILRLTLKAETGGVYGNNSGIPPDIENQFLKHVLAFEHGYARARNIKLFELVGSPACKPAALLNDQEIADALQQLESMMKDKGVVVEFNRPRDARFKYLFITEELFDHETDDMQMPGMTRHFLYEEFHPDHEMEIEARTNEFFSDWFQRSVKADCWYLGEYFIQPDAVVLSKDELLTRLGSVFDAYTAFENGQYNISNISFKLYDEGPSEGLGYAEGTVQYDAILENNERKKITGPFKIYCSREYGWWSIMFFYLAGFNA